MDDLFGNEEDNNQGNIDDLKEKANQIKEGNYVEEPKVEIPDKKEEKKEEDEEAPTEQDLFKIIADNDQKEEKIFPEGKELSQIESQFKKINLSEKELMQSQKTN